MNSDDEESLDTALSYARFVEELALSITRSFALLRMTGGKGLRMTPPSCHCEE